MEFRRVLFRSHQAVGEAVERWADHSAPAQWGRLSWDQRPQPLGQRYASGLRLALLADLQTGVGAGRQCQEGQQGNHHRSEEHTSELQSLMRISYAVFCLKKKQHKKDYHYYVSRI